MLRSPQLRTEQIHNKNMKRYKGRSKKCKEKTSLKYLESLQTFIHVHSINMR